MLCQTNVFIRRKFFFRRETAICWFRITILIFFQTSISAFVLFSYTLIHKKITPQINRITHIWIPTAVNNKILEFLVMFETRSCYIAWKNACVIRIASTEIKLTQTGNSIDVVLIMPCLFHFIAVLSLLRLSANRISTKQLNLIYVQSQFASIWLEVD